MITSGILLWIIVMKDHWMIMIKFHACDEHFYC